MRVCGSDSYALPFLLHLHYTLIRVPCAHYVFIAAAERPTIYFVRQPPDDVIGHVGGSVYINCSARSRDPGQGEVKVSWLKDGQDAVNGDPRRSVTETGALLIAPVMTTSGTSGAPVSDEGVYMCVASRGTDSIVSTPVTLRVASESLSIHRQLFVVIACLIALLGNSALGIGGYFPRLRGNNLQSSPQRLSIFV